MRPDPDKWVEGIRERQSSLIQEVMDLEKDWPEGKQGGALEDAQLGLRERAERLMGELEGLAKEVQDVFLAAPFSSLNEPIFAWASYEICNARLNLTYLLLFGVNAHHKTIHPTPAWQGH